MVTFEALQQRVSSRLKDPDNVDISVSNVSAIINDSIRHWSRKRFWFNEFQETVILTAGNPVFALTTNPNPIEIFKKGGMTIDYGSTRWPLQKVSPKEYDEMNAQGRGIPFVWVYRNGGYEVYWYPSADYNLIVRGLKRYDDLVNNIDTNDFTNNAVSLIMYEALARAYAEFRQDEKMEAYYSARARNEFNILKEETNNQNASGHFHVEGL